MGPKFHPLSNELEPMAEWLFVWVAKSGVQPSLGPMNLMFFVIQIGSVTGKVGGIIAF